MDHGIANFTGMNGVIGIRPATRDDIEAIMAIQSAALPESRWRASDYLNHFCSVAEIQGRVAGFLVSRDTGEDREILNLAVAPEFRRKGVAEALVKRELERGLGACFLEVRESNTAAQALYRKLGFEKIAVRSGYYHDPPERAIVMRFFSC